LQQQRTQNLYLPTSWKEANVDEQTIRVELRNQLRRHQQQGFAYHSTCNQHKSGEHLLRQNQRTGSLSSPW
jgi:hypothetical protein